MDNNWRVSIGYICVALVLVSVFIGGAWVMSPQEFTFKIEMDNNTREAFESIDYEMINNDTIFDLGNPVNYFNCSDEVILKADLDKWGAVWCKNDTGQVINLNDVNVATGEGGGK